MTDFSISYVGGSQIRFHQALYLRPREIESCRILYIESGRGEFVFAEEILQIEDQTLLLLSPGIRESRYEGTSPVSYRYIEFKSDPSPIDVPYLKYQEFRAHFQTITSLLRSTLVEPGLASRLIPTAIELMLLDPSPSDSRAKPDKRIQHVLRFIETNLHSPLQVTRLAREAGISEPQFRRLFREAMGIGPKQYLLRERMHYAQRILHSEGLRVGEVAELLQFETVYQFSNQYKKVHGHSPTRA